MRDKNDPRTLVILSGKPPTVLTGTEAEATPQLRKPGSVDTNPSGLEMPGDVKFDASSPLCFC
jgi:hypothetical protein